MAPDEALLEIGQCHVVGSFGGSQDMRATTSEMATTICDIAEIRLDLLKADSPDQQSNPWDHLSHMPLLFTARRMEEGGALPLSASERMGMLEAVIDEASIIDIEVASIIEMDDLIESAKTRGLSWIASFHDFTRLPETGILLHALEQAREAGASAFKLAAFLDGPAHMARLAEFQLQDHGLPVSTMGMGPLAPVSRLLCAQCGSVLNYGYIGAIPTAPGQWDAESLKEAIAKLSRLND